MTTSQKVPGEQESYLIAERGHFVAGNAPIPRGAPAPSGSVLTLVVDAVSGQVTDVGIQGNYPDLAQLGPVTTDLRAAAAAPAARRGAGRKLAARRGAGRNGILTGAITFGGGPPAPGRARKAIAGAVSVVTAGGRVVAHERVRAGHDFRFKLAPGRYRLEPKAGGCSPTIAVVRAGRTTRADAEIGCNVP